MYLILSWIKKVMIIIFVRDGKLGAYIFEINTKEDVQEFIDLNKLKNTK